MSDIKFVTEGTVKLIDHMGSDHGIAQAARVSTLGEEVADYQGNDAGLIGYLMRKRHGSPFEHNSMQFFVSAPQFVFYEWHRHRIGFSYNEESGRYREMKPVFYVPPWTRPVVQVGKASEYRLEQGTDRQKGCAVAHAENMAKHAWNSYQAQLEEGICREVARNVLPVNLIKSMYVTCNVRSLLSLLSLRTKHPDAQFPSDPLWEFARIADELEQYAQDLFPISFEAFNKHRRVAP